MSESLATKYRPKTFESTLSQKSIIQILTSQIRTGNISNVYLFAGPSGTGKTTLARIFANEINGGHGTPIEIDGASNNGVDNIRSIVEESHLRSIDSTYKIYIIDECHQITTAGWNAFLKCIEEPPMYTIFMFCTTDPQKLPSTILNRMMRFNLTKVPTSEIKSRLSYICEQEGFLEYSDSIDYIAKLASGCVREAISNLEKCSKYSNHLTIENTLCCLGNFSYESMFNLTNALVDKDEKTIINLLEDYYNNGYDLKLFVDTYLDFVLDLQKYCLFKDINLTKIPLYLENGTSDANNHCFLKYVVGFEGNVQYFSVLLDKVLALKNSLKGDTTVKTSIIVSFLSICRGI